MRNIIAFFTATIGISLVASIYADDNVREVQTKLERRGVLFWQIDGAYNGRLSTALTRYQVRKGLPITGQLDVDTARGAWREARGHEGV